MTSPEEHPAQPAQRTTKPAGTGDAVVLWLTRVVATIGAIVVIWAAWATGPMLVHGHPAYAILLAIVLALCVLIGVRAWRARTTDRRRFKVLRGVGLVLSLAVIAICAWLVPSSATEPALSAMRSDSAVTVTETATGIMLAPSGAASEVGVFFQPGARVDARAYAAVLRPLAESGHPVWIAKQPLGIAFLSTGAFGKAREAHEEVANWVVGGHSLGGTVAAIDADTFSDASSNPVVGLMLYASYPASNMSTLSASVLSLSGALDGLATPAKIEASRADLPPGTSFVTIDGAVHSFFGDYGKQAGDGTPTIAQDAAREIIANESVSFVDSLSR